MTPTALTALECLPLEELQSRHARCRSLLARHVPDAGGLLVHKPLSIYYLTGTLGAGVFWLPQDGEPVLCLRKGYGRACVESPLAQTGGRVASFRSYKDLPGLCGAFPEVLAVDMDGFSWAQGELLRSRLPSVTRFAAGDGVLARTRMVKSAWELGKMRLAGERHARCLRLVAPPLLRPGLTEREIGTILLQIFMENGHSGLVRLSGDAEVFLGYVSAGESGLYPTGFDGPLGVRGMDASTPYLGDAGTVWKDLLTLDVGFVLEGYNTDKTLTCWAGPMRDDVQRAHDCCRYIEERIAAMMRPGVLPSSLWAEAQKMAEEAGYADTFMGCGAERVRFLGHGLGLELNEFPAIADHFNEPLEENMVMAVEPKIVIPGLGMVGVEDTFIIGEAETECITGDNSLLAF